MTSLIQIGFPRRTVLVPLLSLGALLGSSSAPAATRDVFLRVDQFQIPANAFGNAAPITMWGFIQTDATFTPLPGAVASAPGPALQATEGDTLNLHVMNKLPTASATVYTEPISVVIPGQTPVLAPGTWPTWTDGTKGNRAGSLQRVRSFTTETATGATSIYTFANLKPGSFLYQSGTHPAVQVQMGLYGCLSVLPVAAGQAYGDASTAFDSEVTLLFSEIDPAQHASIAAGHYGPNPPVPAPADWLTSTINYLPRYFLINGAPWKPGALPIPAGVHGKKLLIRFLNAGLQSRVPMLQGAYALIVGEDGNFLTITDPAGRVVPAARQQYSVLLPAGKTIDAIVTTPSVAGRIPVYDRRLALSNGGAASPGGMLVHLETR